MTTFSDQINTWIKLLASDAIPYDTQLIPVQQTQTEQPVPIPASVYPGSIHAMSTLMGVNGDLDRPATLKGQLAKVNNQGAVHVTAANTHTLRTNEDQLDGTGAAVIDFNGETSSVIYFRPGPTVVSMKMAVATKRTQKGTLYVQGLDYLTIDQTEPPAVVAIQGIGVILAGDPLDDYKVWWTV